jgi:hypothetical protein
MFRTRFQSHKHFTEKLFLHKNVNTSLFSTISVFAFFAKKAAYKMLVKLTSAVNFTNILSCIFCTKFWRQKFQSCDLGLKFFGAKISYKKAVDKMLMKWTSGRRISNEPLHVII